MTIDDPISLPCGVTLPNRVALAPLTNLQSEKDGSLGDDEYTWLVRRGEGGFGLVSTCAAFVSDEGSAWPGQLGIARDGHDAGLTRLAKGLSETGTIGIVQLYHGGDKATLAPDLRLGTSDAEGVRGATIEDLERVKTDFVDAARRAERCGFQGVEIHGANGYLFTQFLAPEDNPRTDDYGGSLENRARFLRETLQAVREAVSASFAVGVRISPVDVWAERGLILEDGVQVSRWLAEDGADFVHLSLSDASGEAPHEPGRGVVARAVRDALPAEVPVFAAGGIWTREEAERAVEAGVDVVVLGRSAIAHADWPRVSTTPEWEPHRPKWDPEHLRAAAVGSAFLEYLNRFPGLVEGGAPAREA